MKKRFSRFMVILATLALVLTLAPSVAAEGLCNNTSSLGKVFAHREYTDYQNASGERFDHVGGSATTQDLDNCLGSNFGAEDSILPANLQTSAGIYQLGWNENTINGRRFLYVFCPNCGGDAITMMANGPVVGDSYQYDIWLSNLPSGDMQVHFKIINKTASPDVTVVDVYKTTSYNNKGEVAWWGAERQQAQDGLGHSHGDGQEINVRKMYYSTIASSGDSLITGLTSNDVAKDGNAGSDQHYHIGTNTNTNDQVDFDNTQN